MASAAWIIAPMFDMVLLDVATLSQQLQLSADRDTEDPSSATLPTRRPDLCIWHRGSALLFKGEDKSPKDGHTLQNAIDDLGVKMSSRWSVLTMGSLPYLPCYASCGARVQFHMIKRNTNTPIPVSDVFDLCQVRPKLTHPRCLQPWSPWAAHLCLWYRNGSS